MATILHVIFRKENIAIERIPLIEEFINQRLYLAISTEMHWANELISVGVLMITRLQR